MLRASFLRSAAFVALVAAVIVEDDGLFEHLGVGPSDHSGRCACAGPHLTGSIETFIKVP